MLFSVRCGRVERVPVLVIQGRAAWVRSLAFGLGSRWRAPFQGLRVVVSDVGGVVRAVVDGSLHRLKRRRRVVSWLWQQVEELVQQELSRIAGEALRVGMNDGDADALGAAIAKRARRGAARSGRDVQDVFADLMIAERERLGAKVAARERIEAAAVASRSAGDSLEATRQKVMEVFRASGFSRRDMLGVRA